jgi:hypothetical protein
MARWRVRRHGAQRAEGSGKRDDVYARELDRNAALKTARDESALAAEQAHRLYQYGRTDFLSVLDADRTLAATTPPGPPPTPRWHPTRSRCSWLGGGWEQK